MKNIILVVCFSLLFAACTAPADGPGLKVEIDDVVRSKQVAPVDGITVSGQPGADALKVFADSGYTTVIDLRGVEEPRGLDEAQVVESLGMQYLQLPIEKAEDVSFENAELLSSLIEQAPGPVLVHCGSGNRVGALLALAQRADGKSIEESVEYGVSGGLTRLREQVEETMKQASSEESAP